ncbi:PEP-CTERM sorting domain-containing protein [Pontiella agarivorans]|uniref:PEP-CTERM sorting domain-containing protein n=1 Tax=Pontiella agarivorans TaxID=3038953 RepID=A0ABU5MTJ8_9BACT|nr:PEP-CTERM sorting domain-containing protein [Pontiella agarivorans]MDZ8117544.1 PEP-CTERM sorting domain-containing protein [Pontiella agarivorans]
MNTKILTAGLAVAGLLLNVSADVVWNEDFEGAALGATSGNNQTLAGTSVQTANTASSVVVDSTTDPAAAAAFTFASGNFIRLSASSNDYAAVRSALNPISFAQVSSDATYTLSFDIYIPVTLDKAVGDIQPRFKLNGAGGSGATDASQTVADAGQYHIVYTGQISDFINTDVNEARPFIGIDQDGGKLVQENFDYMYMDNIQLEVIPEPATLGLVAAFGGGIILIRRRFMM